MPIAVIVISCITGITAEIWPYKRLRKQTSGMDLLGIIGKTCSPFKRTVQNEVNNSLENMQEAVLNWQKRWTG